jgi:hypothetical protein
MSAQDSASTESRHQIYAQKGSKAARGLHQSLLTASSHASQHLASMAVMLRCQRAHACRASPPSCRGVSSESKSENLVRKKARTAAEALVSPTPASTRRDLVLDRILLAFLITISRNALNVLRPVQVEPEQA